MLCLGLLAPLAPRLARRFGLERALVLALAVLIVALAARAGAGPGTLFAGTLVAAGAIGAANVLAPALVKQAFPERTGTLMGVYTMCLTGSAALAAGLTVPLGELVGAGWRGARALWSAPGLLALLVWLPVARTASPPPVAAQPWPSLLRDPLAWQVTLRFGLQSLSFYAVLAWLPSIYRGEGLSAAQAGVLLSLSTLVQAPVSLLVPRLALRLPDQRALVVAADAAIAVGFLGILVAPTAAPYLWVVVLGVGHGAAFALGAAVHRAAARSSSQTAQLSAMAQTIGYTVAAGGPLLVGALHSATGSWTPPLALLLGLLVPQLLVGLGAARARYVGGTAAPPGRRGRAAVSPRR